MRRKLLGYLFACSYANNEIHSKLCQRINVSVRCTRSANERKKNCLQGKKKTVLVVSVVLKDMKILLILKGLLHHCNHKIFQIMRRDEPLVFKPLRPSFSAM